MGEEKEVTEREHKELSLLYQVTVSDLANFKSQQWTITNYALLALGVVVAIPKIEGIEVGLCGRFILCQIATVVFGLAVWILWRLKSSIEVRRERLEGVFAKFSQTFRDARGEKKKISATEVFVFLAVVLTIGLGFVWWLVYVNRLLT